MSYNSSKYISSSYIMIYIRPFRLRLECQLNLWFERGFIFHVVKIDLTYLLLLNNTFWDIALINILNMCICEKKNAINFQALVPTLNICYKCCIEINKNVSYWKEGNTFNLFHRWETMQLYSGSSVIYLQIVFHLRI